MFQKDRTKFFRNRCDQMKVGTGEHFDFPFREPCGDLAAVTLGTGTIAATVVNPERMITVVATEQASAACCGVAGRYVENRFFLRREQHISKMCDIIA
jgi:hypothetical protein